jgi:glycosyltransferase involved in cell wall biosynthesis
MDDPQSGVTYLAMHPTSFIRQVTPIVLTFNEAPNIRRSLEKLQAFDEVVIVDSGSTDETLQIVSEFSNTRVITRTFDSHASQWNFALSAGALKTEWALALDADYILSDEFVAELDTLTPSPETMAYQITFDYCIFGRKLSATLYPPVVALYRHAHTRYIQDGHTQRAQVTGQIGELKSRVMHDDRKPLSRWLASQAKYADLEADLLLNKPAAELRIQDRLRRMIIITPWLVPLYCLTVGRGLLDGWAGIYYALQRGIAEAVLALKLIESRMQVDRS